MTFICFYLHLILATVLLMVPVPLMVPSLYVFSEWRSIRPVEINQYGITIVTHYDITMGNNVSMDAYCAITMTCDVDTIREESHQTNVILQYKLLASILSAVCSVI